MFLAVCAERPEASKLAKILEQLEMIECTRSAQGSYRRRYALTGKQKAIVKALGFTNVAPDHDVDLFHKRVPTVFEFLSLPMLTPFTQHPCWAVNGLETF